jgi:hypothetical protein
VPANSGLVFLLDVDRAAGLLWPETMLEAAFANQPWTLSEQSYLAEMLENMRRERTGQFLFATFDHRAAGPHAMLFAATLRPLSLMNSCFDYQSLLRSRENSPTVADVLTMEKARTEAGGFSGDAVAHFLEQDSGEVDTALSKQIAAFLGRRVAVFRGGGAQNPVYEFLFSDKSVDGYNGSIALAPADRGLVAVGGGHGRTMLEAIKQGDLQAVDTPDLPTNTWLGLWWTPSKAAHEAYMLAPLAKTFATFHFGQPVLGSFFDLQPDIGKLTENIPEIERLSLISWAEKGLLKAELKIYIAGTATEPDSSSEDAPGAKPIH